MSWVATDERVDAPAPSTPTTSAWEATTPRAWYDPRAHWASGLQTADDAVRAAANAVTFGMADRFAGWAGGAGTDAEVKKSQEARERSPVASIAGDVAGSVAVPGMGGARLAAAGGNRLLPRIGAYAAEGAGVGALQGAGTTYTGNAEDYVTNAAKGLLLGGATGGIMGGAFAPRGMVSGARRADIPAQEHYTNSAYDLLRANPTQYGTPEFRRAANDLESNLYKRFDPAGDSAPGSFRAVDRMHATNVVTPKSIEDIRQTLGDIAPTMRADRKAARQVRETLDDFLINPPPGAVHPSQAASAREAAAQAADARAANAALERTRTLTYGDEGVQNAALAAHSGLNLENKYRQFAAKMLNPTTEGGRARLAGYNPAERAAIRNILDPGPWAERLRYAGNWLGGGGGIGAQLTGVTGSLGAGYLSDEKALGLLGAGALAGGGLGLRMAANRAATARMQRAIDLVAERSPLYQRRLANAPMVAGPGVLSPANVSNARDAITYQLLRQPQQEAY